MARLDPDEKSAVGSPYGGPERNIINESGLYALVLARKPDAKAFKKWVTSEVLPSIYKTGAYGNAPQAAFPLVKVRLGNP
jgi:prophage antirepressor-like protein